MIAHATFAALCIATPLALPSPRAALSGGGNCPGTLRASVRSNGTQGNAFSGSPSISSDGRFVAFASQASNLVTGDTNASGDIFLHDTLTGTTSRVSVSSSGGQASAFSFEPSISGDGRFVAFYSSAADLVTGDTNNTSDVFLHDTQTGTTTLISKDSNGDQGRAASTTSSISFDGRFVAFVSNASNLVPGDLNAALDVFLRDTLNGTTILVSVDSSGGQGNSPSLLPSISADGRLVAFWSSASNLVPGDTNGRPDVFLRDTQTGTTTRISVDSTGAEGNGDSWEPSISADGLWVAFYSDARNLVAGDSNGLTDIFLHDIQTGVTTRVSVSSSGAQGDAGSYLASISGDGRFVAFHSASTNFVTGDLNGALDIFLHDTLMGTTSRASVASNGSQSNGGSSAPSLSADGRFVGFSSYASNLVTGDTNGGSDIFLRCTGAPSPCYTKYCTVADGNINNVTNLDATGCDLAVPIRLGLSNGPPNQFAYLLIGSSTGVVNNPAGSIGDLCLVGGFLSRYSLDVGQISALGTFSVDISNSASGGPMFGIPNSGGATIQIGETWNFQFWHRVPAGQPSGFSEAITITFY